MKKLLLLLLICLSCSVSSVTTLSTIELTELTLEELMNIDITVASKTAQKTVTAPSSVTVFTRQELLAMGIDSVEELLNFVPGFQATREIVGGQGYMVAARGSSTPQASYNILFMLDGQRLNDDLSGGALFNNRFMPISQIKQIEVIRGPGSALYGTGAFTGVVNIITETNTNSAALSSGNLNSRKASANLAYQENNWQASLFVNYFSDEGEVYDEKWTRPIDPTVTATRDPKKGKEAYVTYRWDDRLQINMRYMERQLRDFFLFNVVKDGVILVEERQDFIHFNYQLADVPWKTSLDGGYLVTRETSQSAEGDFLGGREQKETEWYLGLNGEHRVGKHNLLAGLTFRRPDVEKSRNLSNVPTQGRELVTTSVNIQEGYRDIMGLYLQDQYQFSEHLELTAGMRYDHYSDFGTSLNPRIALLYTTDFEATFKLMYGEAFRAPSIRQTAALNVGNPNLEPEKVSTTELAWIQEYSGMRTTLTYFYNQFENKIDTVVRSGGGGRVFMNTTDLTTAGWEFETMITVKNDFSLRSAYTYLSKTEEEPRRVAQQTFSLIANYQRPPWNFNINAYYHDEIEQKALLPNLGLTTITLADYWVLNSTIRYNLNESLTLTGQIHNLLDETYTSSTKVVNFTAGVPNRGRTYSLGIEMRF